MAGKLKDLLHEKPVFINVGVREFGDTLREAGWDVSHVDWSPPRGGTPKWPRFSTICSRSVGAMESKREACQVSVKALSVGAAASLALSTPGAALRLHSIFPSTLNLAVEAAPIIVALTGPSGVSSPHAVALDRAVVFPSLQLASGNRGWLSADSIRLTGGCGGLTVNLGQARRPPVRVLPAITRCECAWRASVSRLEDFQSHSFCDLHIDAVVSGKGAATPMAAALARAARALGRAARAMTASVIDARGPGRGAGPEAALFRAVASLVGMGAGLTPSGDDFLSGFIAASRASGSHALVSVLGQAVEANIDATGEISASLLRCAVGGHWPAPLADLADALAAQNEPEALRALDSLCRLGHSSGADMATGFLFGLAILPRHRDSR